MTKLNLHVGGGIVDSERRVFDAVVRASKSARAGEDHVTCSTWDALARVMSAKRFELLAHLRRQPEASIAALARRHGCTGHRKKGVGATLSIRSRDECRGQTKPKSAQCNTMPGDNRTPTGRC